MKSHRQRAGGNLASAREIRKTLASFNALQIGIFYVCALLLIASSGWLIHQLFVTVTHPEPTTGGSLTEGILGAPRLINPVLAQSAPDYDLVELIYSGLLTYNDEGELITEIADSYTVSDNSLVYIFTLKPDVRFHDGRHLDADDIVYTITHIQDPLVKSPLRPTWEGVSVEKIDNLTVQFTLTEPYAGFLEAATVGILPKHIWQGVSYEHLYFSSFNTAPIGAGPYQITGTRMSKDGSNVSSYNLHAFGDYILGRPFISKLKIKFFDDINNLEDALYSGEIDSTAYLTYDAQDSDSNSALVIETTTLPRIFGLYLNDQNNPLLRDIKLRKALADAIDRQKIIDTVLAGQAIATDQPLPPRYLEPAADISAAVNPDTVTKELDSLGWKLATGSTVRTKTSENGNTPLTFTITTLNHPTLIAVADELVRQFAAVGVEVAIQPVDTSELIESTIPKREFAILLFGQTYQHETNAYAFWHSSQRSDPGLNITNYANTRTDRLLDTIFSEIDFAKNQQALKDFAEIITAEHPAIFLYSPKLVYLSNTPLSRPTMQNLAAPEHRFADIHRWYINTRRILNWFDTTPWN